MFTLSGRTCVFAGATGMIGRGAVKALAEGGMNVAMITHNADSAAEIIESLGEYGTRAAAFTNSKSDAEAFENVLDRFGSVDVVISNTGGFNAVKDIESITEEEINRKMQHQVTGAFIMAQAAMPYLEKSRAGRIIFMTSAGAQDGFTGENIVDSIARGAVISMTYCLARQLAGRNITVNCIAKSGIINDHEPHRPGDYDSSSVIQSIPVGRIGTNAEFGAAVAYLASEEAGFVTGQIINLSGGIHIG